MSSAAADFQDLSDDGKRTLKFSGSLTLSCLRDLPGRLGDLQSAEPLRVDISDVDRIDTIGAWLIYKLKRDEDAEIVGASEDAKRLLVQVEENDKPVKVRPDSTPPFLRVLGDIGRAVINTAAVMGGFLAFFGATLIATWGVIRNPRRFRFNSVIRQFEVVGVNSLGIIGLMSFLVGIVIAQQGAVQLRQFGAEAFTVNLIGRLTLRELGVLMTAIMVAGRSGSAFAAQIGSMKLAEEVDAMRTIGVSPFDVLVIPRVLAATIIMPLLGFYACVIAIIGGGVFCWISLEMPPITYVLRLREVVPMTDLWIGLIKAPVFGAIVAVTGCFEGMLVENNAEEVGSRTTSAVVIGIFLTIVLDAVFALFFSSIGWI